MVRKHCWLFEDKATQPIEQQAENRADNVIRRTRLKLKSNHQTFSAGGAGTAGYETTLNYCVQNTIFVVQTAITVDRLQLVTHQVHGIQCTAL